MSSSPQVIESLSEWLAIRRDLQAQGRRIGFVPTMGALHEGHASLLERARAENDICVLSIYVNPTQFDNKDDLAKYPKTLEQDLSIAGQKGVDFVLLPSFDEIYPDGYRYKISENDLSTRLCGAHRPGHFDGVLTVVMKLLNLVGARRAYFGEKDFQQLQLVRKMAEAFFMDVEIVPCPTVREADGLAMSSRNVRLSPQDRERAPQFHAALIEEPSARATRKRLEAQGFEVDYIEDIENRRYGAVKLGAVRLIDNVERLSVPAPVEPKLKVLITSGGTREPIDGVRCITNFSTGRTGAQIAEVFLGRRHEVTLLHGEGAVTPKPSKALLTRPYSSFNDLSESLKHELESKAYDVVIHAAAVSDYSVASVGVATDSHSPTAFAEIDRSEKLESNADLVVRLRTNPKLVDRLRENSINKNLQVVAFKLTRTSDSQKRREAIVKLSDRAKPDYIVHNDMTEISAGEHRFSIYSCLQSSLPSLIGETFSSSALASQLEELLVSTHLTLKRGEK